jgi:hypothetical protein
VTFPALRLIDGSGSQRVYCSARGARPQGLVCRRSSDACAAVSSSTSYASSVCCSDHGPSRPPSATEDPSELPVDMVSFLLLIGRLGGRLGMPKRLDRGERKRLTLEARCLTNSANRTEDAMAPG